MWSLEFLPCLHFRMRRGQLNSKDLVQRIRKSYNRYWHGECGTASSLLRLGCRCLPATGGLQAAHGTADLTRGGGSYAWPRSGCLLACPLQPDTSRREGSLVKSAVALNAWSRNRGPFPYFAVPRQPTGVKRRRCGSASGSSGVRAVLAARAARRAALKDVQEVFTGTC